MPRRNAQSKTTNSTDRRAGARLVGPDEFKHELLKFARRNGKPLFVIGVSLANADTLRSVTEGDAMDKLSRSIRSAISHSTEPSHLVTSLSATTFLVLSLETTDEIISEMNKRFSTLTLPGLHVRPTFAVSAQTIRDDEIEAALKALGCEIDEHGELREKTKRDGFSQFGSKAGWAERYEGDGEEVIDRWRQTKCRRLAVPLVQLAVPTDAIVKRAKALQSLDHPGIDPLRDFWMDEQELVLIVDVASGKTLTDWLASRTVGASACTTVTAAADLVLEYISILLYGKSLTPPIHLHGLTKHIRVSSPERRLHLSDGFQLDVITSSDETIGESDLVRDAESFAKLVGAKIPTKQPTLHKLRAAIKDNA